jgi:hypothetical protein
MLTLTPEPAGVDAALPAYTLPYALPAYALHSHAPFGPSRDGLSPATARAGTASGGSRFSSFSVFLAPLAHGTYVQFPC